MGRSFARFRLPGTAHGNTICSFASDPNTILVVTASGLSHSLSHSSLSHTHTCGTVTKGNWSGSETGVVPEKCLISQESMASPPDTLDSLTLPDVTPAGKAPGVQYVARPRKGQVQFRKRCRLCLPHFLPHTQPLAQSGNSWIESRAFGNT